MKKLFVFKVQSLTDVITNSSSELFVFNHDGAQEALEELLYSIYDNWTSEYESPIRVVDMDDGSLDNYIRWVYDRDWFADWDKERAGTLTRENSGQTGLCKRFNGNPETFYENYNEWEPMSKDWNIKQLRISKEGYNVIRKCISPNEWALYSIHDNPDWDYQEILSDYATRYHLG